MTMKIPQGNYILFGASGLMGSHALLALKEQEGVHVKAIHHHSELKITGSNITPYRVDLRDQDEVMELCKGCDYALIYSGIVASTPVLLNDPISPVLDTLRITTNCLDACYKAQIQDVVWLSSTTGYSDATSDKQEHTYMVDEPPENWHLTGWTFRYLEMLSHSIAAKLPSPINVTALRPTMIYGDYASYTPGMSHFLPTLIHSVLSDQRPIQIWGNGEQKRDLIYAGDVVTASLKALKYGSGFAQYNISSGCAVTVNECLTKILSILDIKDATTKYSNTSTPGVKVLEIPNQCAKSRLGFTSSTPLHEGLKKMIRWYETHLSENKRSNFKK